MPIFGQIVVGPPGSGKTTYCHGMLQFFEASGRKAVVFNMDPANEQVPYEAAVDICDLVSANNVAKDLSLGPNGSLLYAMELLEKNVHWLEKKLETHSKDYILFDFPGQIELYTHNDCIRNIVQKLISKGHRITAVNLVDSHYCADASKFIAVMLTSLTVMIQLELPAINVLSKVDLIEQYGELPQNLDFFTEQGDLSQLVHLLGEDRHFDKFAKLNQALVGIIDDFPFVGYHTLNIQDKESVVRLLRAVDKSNGYIYANVDAARIARQALVAQSESDTSWTFDVQQRYMKN